MQPNLQPDDGDERCPQCHERFPYRQGIVITEEIDEPWLTAIFATVYCSQECVERAKKG